MSLIEEIKRDAMAVHLYDAHQIAAALLAADVLADTVGASRRYTPRMRAALTAYRKAVGEDEG